MKKNKRVVIVGLDGVPYELIKDLAAQNIMPCVKKLLLEGTLKKMTSSIPEVSSCAWSSIITGVNPAEHGIFGFTDLHPHSYKMRFPNFTDLNSKPFWLARDTPSVIINLPSSYPVSSLNGVHISGFVSIDFERSVFPKTLMPTLESLDYRLDVDSQLAHQSMDLFLADLDKTLQARIKTYRYLWEHQTWSCFMLVFTGTDRLMHFLWEAYDDKEHKYHQHFLEHFKKIDAVIGEIDSKLNSDDALIMLSDHGFEALNQDVYINAILRENGFQEFTDAEPDLNKIDEKTQAFALDPARIYINTQDKYPKGTVTSKEQENVAQKLQELFNSFTIDGKKVIKKVYRKEEIYSGPFMDAAPDLVLVGEKGFNLKANIKANTISGKGIFTGKHTQDNAFLFAKGNFNPADIVDNPSVFEAARLFNA